MLIQALFFQGKGQPLPFRICKQESFTENNMANARWAEKNESCRFASEQSLYTKANNLITFLDLFHKKDGILPQRK